MLIETMRFGSIEVDEGKLITFPDGVLGFPKHHRFALLQTSPDPALFWLQSVEDPDLAFVVCDPLLFVPDYQVPIRKDDLESLGLHEASEGQVLVIVNKVGTALTGNLLGPLVVNPLTLTARQLVLSDKRYSTRHPLRRAGAPQTLAKTA
jgi:flagellar assembly factor FliW